MGEGVGRDGTPDPGSAQRQMPVGHTERVQRVASFLPQDLGVVLPQPLPTSQGAKALLLLPHEEGIPEIPDSVILGASSIPDEALSYSISLMSLPDTAVNSV